MAKILHLHIPKTGGVAIRHHLATHLGEKRVSDTIIGYRLKDALVQFDHLDVISGHFLLQQGDQLPRDRCSITVLRHPFDRFLSEFFYQKIDCANRLLDTRLQGLGLDTYLQQLSLTEQEAMSAQIAMIYQLGTSSRTVLSLEEKSAAALKAVESIEFVGLQDELEDFACMLDAKFGWSHVPLKLKNTTSQRIKLTELTPQQTKKLSELFPLELELYHYAKSRFKATRRELLKRSVTVGFDAEATPAASQPDNDAAASCSDSPVEFGDKRCTIEEVSVVGEISGGDLAMVGERFDILIRLKSSVPIDTLNASIAIKDERGMLMFSTTAMQLGHAYSLKQGEYIVRFNMLNRLPRGNYHIDAALMESESPLVGCYHWHENVATFKVHDTIVTHFEGHIFMDADVSMKSATDEPTCEDKQHVAGSNHVRALGYSNKQLTQFKATIKPTARIENVFPGMDICVPVRVENTGKEPWGASGKQSVALTYRWLTKSGKVIVADGVRTQLPSDVPPGNAVVVPMQISVPNESQSMRLVISLVQEAVAWFVDKNPGSAHVVAVDPR
ncbi:Wzt carbohydrate-binding domain-containing protein [Dyella acidiphila]|uniref:Wzt carbohydrate-binding domain-containing protein n=1 Tax=Dyella acidiphila TaxID=2775866 RepID=A0ABR9G8U7_9GAMM|nr:Wzt carbohydrate-binding domain-containing protein [Dyella acidiphila]MBE1160469.1 Wzt carbohydrate-binding domain-containing protein [Dyella acidiphila]